MALHNIFGSEGEQLAQEFLMKQGLPVGFTLSK